MSRIVLPVALLLVLLAPAPSPAAFHLSVIDEVMSGLGGDSTAQYVEIRTLSGTQIFVQHTRLTAFNCDGTTATVLINDLPSNICNGAAGVRWTMGTASWAAATGVTPDFTFPAGIVTPCGQICWGAPGSVVPPANPNSWSATDPNNYVDCVAYGSYTGARQITDAAATTLPPGNGTMSLQRNADTGNDLADFGLATPTPTNNGPCPTTTTSTTVATTTTTSTTTTTVPGPQKSKCTSKEIAAAGKKAGAKAKCHSKAVKKGVAVDGGCLTTAESKFASAYGKATAAGDCLNGTVAADVEGTVDNFINSLTSTLVGGSTAASKCTSKELTAAGKKAPAKAKCLSKAVSKGASVDGGCLTAAETKFGTAYGKATGAGDCINTTDAATAEGIVDSFITNLRNQLGP